MPRTSCARRAFFARRGRILAANQRARVLLSAATMNDATTQSTETKNDDLRALLGKHHHDIGLVLDDLLDAFETDNGPWAARCFATLEEQLRAHFALEEEHVFPVLDRTEHAEVIGLRAEHADMRAQLAALGVALDLHAARLTRIARFVDTLRAHAAREDALAYRLAATTLPTSARTHVIDRLQTLFAKLATRRSARGG
jgi:hypothetical protein